MRRSLTQIVVAAALSLPLPALAQQNANCPPGAWFCAEADIAVPAPAAPQPKAAPPPAADEPVQPPVVQPRPARRPPPSDAPPPPVVIYQPIPTAPPPHVIIVTPGYGYGRPQRVAPPPPPAAPPPRWRSEFGLNLRVEGLALGRPRGAAFNAGMGGVGMSLRYRPVPAFALDLGIDLLAGNDYNGFERTEVPVSMNAMIYLNPKSRVQVYLQGGMHLSRAEVRSDIPSPLLSSVDGSQYGATYTYFGGQGGLGFEFRLSRRVGLNIDGMGFARKRIGDISTPEFYDPVTQRTTNSSGGGLVRGGITLWW